MSPLPADRPVGFGFLATGAIARKLAHDLPLVDGARLVAVGSRDAARAEAFAADHARDAPDAPPVTAHGSYDAVLADPAVDVVYVATPHAQHHDQVVAALEAGKHVLCEKPLTLDAATAQHLVDLATEHDRFLMEAMWMTCHPTVRRAADDLRAGRFGTPHQLRAELGFRVDADPDSRMLDPALGASALLDMGVYPLTLAHLLLGEAEHLTGVATLSERGIDLDVTVVGRYPGGVLATLGASMTSWSSEAASVATDAGRLELPRGFHHPSHATFTPRGPDGEPVRVEPGVELRGHGYEFQLAEVVRCLRAGERESPLVPHAQTLAILRQTDALLAEVGVQRP